MNEKYEFIMNLPHHTSKKRPQMSRHDRAAQFAPYAALSGYEDAVEETATKVLIEQETSTNSDDDLPPTLIEDLP